MEVYPFFSIQVQWYPFVMARKILPLYEPPNRQLIILSLLLVLYSQLNSKSYHCALGKVSSLEPSRLHHPKGLVAMTSRTINHFELTTDQSPAEVNVPRVQVGDRFSKTVELRKAVERCFRADEEAAYQTIRLEGNRFQKQTLPL